MACIIFRGRRVIILFNTAGATVKHPKTFSSGDSLVGRDFFFSPPPLQHDTNAPTQERVIYVVIELRRPFKRVFGLTSCAYRWNAELFIKIYRCSTVHLHYGVIIFAIDYYYFFFFLGFGFFPKGTNLTPRTWLYLHDNGELFYYYHDYVETIVYCLKDIL